MNAVQDLMNDTGPTFYNHKYVANEKPRISDTDDIILRNVSSLQDKTSYFFLFYSLYMQIYRFNNKFIMLNIVLFYILLLLLLCINVVYL